MQEQHCIKAAHFLSPGFKTGRGQGWYAAGTCVRRAQCRDDLLPSAQRLLLLMLSAAAAYCLLLLLLMMLMLLLQANKQWLILSILNKHVAFEVHLLRPSRERQLNSQPSQKLSSQPCQRFTQDNKQKVLVVCTLPLPLRAAAGCQPLVLATPVCAHAALCLAASLTCLYVTACHRSCMRGGRCCWTSWLVTRRAQGCCRAGQVGTPARNTYTDADTTCPHVDQMHITQTPQIQVHAAQPSQA